MSHCPQCGVAFVCGVTDVVQTGTDAACWCMSHPRQLPLTPVRTINDETARCLCPDCLRARRNAHAKNRIAETGTPD